MLGMEISYTLWPCLTDTHTYVPSTQTWDEVVERLTLHHVYPTKFEAPGFGPYVLHPPARTCFHHQKGPPRDQPHRCDRCVSAITMAVFDADEGTPEEYENTRRLLREAGIANVWYSTYSHGMRPKGVVKTSYRLVMPVSEPVRADQWKVFRLAVRDKFQIKCSPASSSGVSHFYHLPSYPGWTVPEVFSTPGLPLRVGEHMKVRPVVTRKIVIPDFEPPEEPTTPVDLAPLIEKLKAKHTRLVRNPASSQKAALLSAMLNGEPLAGPHERNTATLLVTGMLVYTLPSGTPLSIFRHFLTPSVDKMLAAGSSLTWSEVESMLLRSMRNRFDAEAREAELLRVNGKELFDYLATVTRVVM